MNDVVNKIYNKIYFATNRNLEFDNGEPIFRTGFASGRPQLFRVGFAEVKYGVYPGTKGVPPGTKSVPPKIKKVHVNKDVYSEDNKTGSQVLFEDLRKYLKTHDVDIIIFIHGFSTNFESSIKSAVTLQDKYGDKGRRALVFCFSWPSDGKSGFSGYRSGRDDAESSGIAMRRALGKLIDFLRILSSEDNQIIEKSRKNGTAPDLQKMKQCNRNLHIVAHSMGNWALRHALQRIKEKYPKIPRVIRSTFLMAADADADALSIEDKLADLTSLSENVHVYYANNDKALRLSDKWFNPPRLGQDGPENLSALPDHVSAIDCRKVSDVRVGDLNHSYLFESDEVVEDVIQTLKGVPQDERDQTRTRVSDQRWRLKKR